MSDRNAIISFRVAQVFNLLWRRFLVCSARGCARGKQVENLSRHGGSRLETCATTLNVSKCVVDQGCQGRARLSERAASKPSTSVNREAQLRSTRPLNLNAFDTPGGALG